MRNACVIFAAGGVRTPAWMTMATGRMRCAPGARVIRAPENCFGDGVRAGRRASGVGSAAGGEYRWRPVAECSFEWRWWRRAATSVGR